MMKISETGATHLLRQRAEDFVKRKLSDASPNLIDSEAVALISDLLRHSGTDETEVTESVHTNSQLHLEDVLEGANIGTLEWNIQTGKVKFNEIWANNLGFRRIEIKIGQLLLGQNGWKALTHPDDIPYAEEMLERHFSGEIPYHKVEIRMRHKKGHWVWIRQEGKVKTWTPDGKPLLMYGIHTDITHWKEMEEKLRENEEKYRILFENNPQPMFILDPETSQILEANASFLKHYGFDKAELLSMSASEIFPDKDLPDLKTMEKPTNIGIKSNIKKNGEKIFVELKSHRINFNGKTAVHLLIIDVTEQKRAELALVELNDQLEKRILERTSELQQLNTSLQQTENRLIGVTSEVEERERQRFSRELHDGLGPLLATIKLYFQLLADTEDTEKRKLIIDKGNKNIEIAIQTTRELAKGLSSAFLSEAGYVNAINDFTQRINDTNKIKISVNSNSKARFGTFFELMLFRITTELIKNTLTYAHANNVMITFKYDKSKKMVYFTYADDGQGFDRDKILQEKKGLGLINIMQRVQVMKGEIEINAAPGKGMQAHLVFSVEQKEDKQFI